MTTPTKSTACIGAKNEKTGDNILATIEVFVYDDGRTILHVVGTEYYEHELDELNGLMVFEGPAPSTDPHDELSRMAQGFAEIAPYKPPLVEVLHPVTHPSTMDPAMMVMHLPLLASHTVENLPGVPPPLVELHDPAFSLENGLQLPEQPEGCPPEREPEGNKRQNAEQKNEQKNEKKRQKATGQPMCQEHELVFLDKPSGLLDYVATESEATAPPALHHKKSDNSRQTTSEFLEKHIGYDPKTKTVNGRSHPFVKTVTVDVGAQMAETIFAPHLNVTAIGPVSAKCLIRSLPTAEFVGTPTSKPFAKTEEFGVFLSRVKKLAQTMMALYARVLRKKFASANISTLSDGDIEKIAIVLRHITSGLCKTTAVSTSKPAPTFRNANTKNKSKGGFIPDPNAADGQPFKYVSGQDGFESPFREETGKMRRSFTFRYFRWIFALEYLELYPIGRGLDGLGKEWDKFSRWYRRFIMKDEVGVANKDPKFVVETRCIPEYIVFANNSPVSCLNWETYGRLFFTFLMRFCDATGTGELTFYVE